MSKKKVVIVGAGPCGLAALKEMREAGHDAMAVEKAPAIGGLFSRNHEVSYENLYLTISNMLMAFSDFPPEDLRIKYSSKDEYGAYLEAYAEHFGLMPHIRLRTEVRRAAHEGGRWRITVQSEGSAAPEVLEADALLVATGSNHVPRRIETEGFQGEVVHSAEYRSAKAYAGKRVLVIGSGESAFDVATDISKVAARTTVWSRRPITPAPRFIHDIARDPNHDELEVMKDEAKWSREKVSDFIESVTTSRMANAAPIWAYSAIRHAVVRALQNAALPGKILGTWNGVAMEGDPLRGDQFLVPTKSARLCLEVARGTVDVVVAKRAVFSPRGATFHEVIYRGEAKGIDREVPEVKLDDIDVVLLCTGYRTDFPWLDAPGLEMNPRTWYKHCFPRGLGDKLMFLGWARPHQGGIPACAEILSRYIAMLLDGTRVLPADYAEQAIAEGQAEDDFYTGCQYQKNLVDYPAFMDSVARLIGCLPEAPKLYEQERLMQYWIFPNWPIWYRKNGVGARPALVERVLSAFPFKASYQLTKFSMMGLAYALMQAPVDAILPARSGIRTGWVFQAKKNLLHGNA